MATSVRASVRSARRPACCSPVLGLVGAHRHLVGAEREDVGGHQQRVAVQPMFTPWSG
jgi:hypothetical protein